jgi:hypothetical protein
MGTIQIIAGGTLSHIRPHLALAAPAYGTVGDQLFRLCCKHFKEVPSSIKLDRTKLAGGKRLETNSDVEEFVDKLIADPKTKIIFFPVALCDFEVFHIDDGPRYDGGLSIGKEHSRLKTSDGQRTLMLRPAKKIVEKIRKERKDIFLVAFKTTAGATEDEMFKAGMSLLKKNSCNLVLVNDIAKRMNMVLTPEMARYHVTSDRYEALKGLVEMTAARSGLTFSKTTVVEGDLIKWNNGFVPDSLWNVVQHCIDNGGYKAFNDVTVGHFGFKQGEYLYSSRRKQNYNKPGGTDMVKVKFSDDSVVAYGAKPSAGARSQNRLLNDKYDCVVHFHCPLKEGSEVSVRPQRQFECGSMECGENTFQGMRKHADGLAVVMLDKHGPNLLFNRNINHNVVIDFIEKNFDLSRSTSD